MHIQATTTLPPSLSKGQGAPAQYVSKYHAPASILERQSHPLDCLSEEVHAAIRQSNPTRSVCQGMKLKAL